MEVTTLKLVARMLDPRGMRRRLRRVGAGVTLLLLWWHRAVQVAEGRRRARQRRAARRSVGIRARLDRAELELRQAAAARAGSSAADDSAR